jgi:hypothetical protein
MIDQDKRKNGAGWNLAARTPASERRQQMTVAIAELMAITRVYQRVVENSWEVLNGAARLAAGDARERLREFCDKHDTEKRKRA